MFKIRFGLRVIRINFERSSNDKKGKRLASTGHDSSQISIETDFPSSLKTIQPINRSTDDLVETFETVFYLFKNSNISKKRKRKFIVRRTIFFSFRQISLIPLCVLRKIIALVWKGLTIGEEARAIIIRRHDTCRDTIAIDRFQLQKYLFPQRVSGDRSRAAEPLDTTSPRISKFASGESIRHAIRRPSERVLCNWLNSPGAGLAD